MTKPEDIPQDMWDEAVSALERAWDEHADHFNPLSNTVSEGLWQRFFEATARAILAERERCATLAEEMAKGDDVKPGVTWSSTFDGGYERACTDMAAAIRKGQQ